MKVYFYFPYYDVSGVPVLFQNLADYISFSNPDFEIAVIDYKDGYMAKNCRFSENLSLVIFENNKPTKIDDGCIIMQAVLPHSIHKELIIGSHVKILFWSLFPDNYLPVVFPFVFFQKFAKKHFKFYRFLLHTVYRKDFLLVKNFIINALKLNSLFFMDIANINRLNEIYGTGTVTKKKYLPITTDKFANDLFYTIHNKIDNNHLKIAWVGRLCDFKYESVAYIIKKLSYIAIGKNWRISFNIIGDGPYLNKLKSHKYNNHLFQTYFLGTINKSELNTYLLENIDLNISMGTSALESAKISIPTLIIDYSYRPFPESYKFRWIFETPEFDLGHDISENDFNHINTKCNLEDILSILQHNYHEYSQLCYQYYNDNHSIESVSNKLISYIITDAPEFRVFDNKYFKKGLMRRTYEFIKYLK